MRPPSFVDVKEAQLNDLSMPVEATPAMANTATLRL